MKTRYDEKIGGEVCYADKQLVSVSAVEAREDYTMLLTFSNGERRVYDASPLLSKSVFAPLQALPFFLAARADGGTVVWNEDVDIAPEHLYEASTPAGGVANAG